MKKRIIRIFSYFFVLLLIVSSAIPASAITYDYGEELNSQAALLVNMDTGVTVFEKNAHEKRYPASLTKVMTFIIVSEHIDDFNNTRIEVKQSILDMLLGTGSMTSGLEYHIGDKMTANDLVHCLLVASGNDAALLLADYVGGGNIDNFVKMMNDKAAELGCENTHFVNPHGLHDKDHYTTAYDLYLITSYALTLPHFSEITNTATYYCEGDDYPLTTTNFMIDVNRGGDYYYTYAKGVKTGTTDEAGKCLITSAFADGYAYLCVCMGASVDSDTNGAMVDAKKLMRWALLGFELSRMLTTDTPVCEMNINFSSGKSTVLLYPQTNVNTILPIGYNPDDVTVEPEVAQSLNAPLKKGDIAGKATVMYKGESVQEVNLIVTEDIGRSDLSYTMHLLRNVLMSWQFWIAVIAAVILLVVYFALVVNFKNKKGRTRVKRQRKL